MTLAVLAAVLAVPSAARAQVPFEQAIQDLASEDPAVRQRTLRALRDAAYPEAAAPIAALIIDSQDATQLQAIAAELDIFLAERVTSRRSGEPTIEKRSDLSAEAAFNAGPLAFGLRTVPSEVLNALRVAAHDENRKVAAEALYAYGALASLQEAHVRLALQHVSAADLTELLGSKDAGLRVASARVVGRLFARRAVDPPVDAAVGDALLAALNDKDAGVRSAATRSLGDLRYEAAVPILTDAFKSHAKGALAEAELDALAHIANPASAALFREQLASKVIDCRVIAVEGLARLPGVANLGELQSALAKEREDEVELALSFAATMLADAPIDQIGEALVRPRLRDQARRYLVEAAPGHVRRFTRHLQDPDARIRVDVVEVLTLAGDASALPFVTPLASDQDPVVAFAGGRAVAHLRSGSSRPAS